MGYWKRLVAQTFPGGNGDVALPADKADIGSLVGNEDVAPPTKKADIGSPLGNEDVAPPSEKADIGSPLGNGDVAPPSKKADTGPPLGNGDVALPAENGILAPSIAHNTIFQRDQWDTQLRAGDSYAIKWEYIRNNPVRKGLVVHADDWPYQGELNILRWHDR